MPRLETAIVLCVLLMAATVFGGQNPQVVNVQLVGGRSPALPVGLVLVFMAGLGGTLAFAWPSALARPPALPRREVPRRPRKRSQGGSKVASRDWETQDGDW